MNEELHTFQAGAALPAAQAFLSGLFASLVLTGVIILAGWKPVHLLLGGSLVACAVWFHQLNHWTQLVNHLAGFQAQPVVEVLPPAPAPVRIELLEQREGSWRGDYVDLPATSEQLRLLASGVVEGAPLSENAWCGSGKPFSKAGFHELRTELVRRGWLVWRNPGAPSQGVEPSRVGKRVFEYLSGNHYPTTR